MFLLHLLETLAISVFIGISALFGLPAELIERVELHYAEEDRASIVENDISSTIDIISEDTPVENPSEEARAESFEKKVEIEETPGPAPEPVVLPTGPVEGATVTPERLTELIAQFAPVVSGVGNDDLNATTRKAVVNILCSNNGNSPVRPISGSGVIIDPRGVVLTNAHIAQFQLLAEHYDPAINCIIRTGSPARASYEVELLHISSKWVADNAFQISDPAPVGTGEYDFALLRITQHVNPTTALPSAFPFIPVDWRSVVDKDDTVLLAAYPAGFLGSETIRKSLFKVSAFTTIKRLFTFGTGTADLMSVSGTVVSQKGASGGAVVSKDGELVGIVVTSSEGAQTSERELRAITTGHIDDTLIAELGLSVSSLLSGNLSGVARLFSLNIAPTLARLLVANIR